MKITKGKWGYVYDPENLNVNHLTLDGKESPHISEEGDYILIADAGNTYQECGMLPSELLKKLDRLEGNYEMLEKVRLEWVEKCNELQQANKELEERFSKLKESYSKNITHQQEQGEQLKELVEALNELYEMVAIEKEIELPITTHEKCETPLNKYR